VSDALLGAWQLERFVVRVDDGRAPVWPLGEEATGLVIYEPSGWMSAVLSRGDRQAASGTSLEAAARASQSARAEAFDTYLSYAGRWQLQGDEVHHEVRWALVPGVVGQTLVRRVRWLGPQLQLSYDRPTRSGRTATYSLLWSRP
jgi:hypothetical protein